MLRRHLYDVAQVASKPGRVFLNELEHEIKNECLNYGPVFHVVAPSTKDLEGSVAVSFDTVKAAEECAQSMDGRWFDNVQILVERRGCWEDLASVQLRGTSSSVVLSVEIAPPECFTVIVHNVWTANEAEACGPAFFDELESEFSGECGKIRSPSRSCKAVPREPSVGGRRRRGFQYGRRAGEMRGRHGRPLVRLSAAARRKAPRGRARRPPDSQRASWTGGRPSTLDGSLDDDGLLG